MPDSTRPTRSEDGTATEMASIRPPRVTRHDSGDEAAMGSTVAAAASSSSATATATRRSRGGIAESKDEVEARLHATDSVAPARAAAPSHAHAHATTHAPSAQSLAPASSAALAALALADSDDEEEEDEDALPTIAKDSSGDEDAEDDDEDADASDDAGPTAAQVYARPLLYYKRAVVERRRRDAGAAAQQIQPDQGPLQLLLPDSSMCLGFPPVKRRAGNNGERAAGAAGARGGDGLDDLDHVVVFTPPNDEQASKTKLFACLLLFLIPADLILICTIFFLGGPVVDDMTEKAGTSDIVTFLCAMVALCLGLVGMKMRDTRILTLFIVVFYVDSIINLIRVSGILQLAQFFMQISVCHVMSLYKMSLVPQWWVADP